MKRLFKLTSILLIVFSLLLTSACSSKKDKNDGPKGEVETGVTIEDDKDKKDDKVSKKNDITVEEQVLVDQDGVLIVVKSFNNGQYGSNLKLYLENNTDKNLNIIANEVSINGIMFEPFFAVEMGGGKKSNTEMTFDKVDMERFKIDLIKDIEMKFTAYESESWEDLIKTDIVTIHTSADTNYVQKIDDSGKVVLEENGFKFVFKDIDYKSSYTGPEIKVYIENNSDQDVIVQISDVSINGFMMEPIFSVDVSAGKKAYDAISFFKENFEENGVESMEEMDFKVIIFEMNSWETILESPLIQEKW